MANLLKVGNILTNLLHSLSQKFTSCYAFNIKFHFQNKIDTAWKKISDIFTVGESFRHLYSRREFPGSFFLTTFLTNTYCLITILGGTKYM